MRASRPSLLALFGLCWASAGCSGSDAPEQQAADVGAESEAATDTSSDATCSRGPERNGPYSPVTILDNPGAKGAIDPSVVYPEGAALGMMAFTTVPDEAHTRIAIATSTDSGASWRYAADVTQTTPITISTSDNEVCGKTMCTGTLVHESPALVSDPTDPDASRRLKVFVHSYFFGTRQHFELGYLAMYTAAAPEGPWSETKLFGWHSDSPISTEGVNYDLRTDPRLPEMHDCFIVGEPGALYRAPGVLDLALSCVVATATGGTIEVRLLRSVDHGTTWKWVSTLLSPEDALALGSSVPQINGSALLDTGGKYHLIVTPSGSVNFPGGVGEGYRGCLVIPIDDIEHGKVARCAGKPIVEASYLGMPGQFVGTCSADLGAKHGMLIPVPDFSNPSAVGYRIFASGLPLP